MKFISKKSATTTKNLSEFREFALEKQKQHKLKGGTSSSMPYIPGINDFIIDETIIDN